MQSEDALTVLEKGDSWKYLALAQPKQMWAKEVTARKCWTLAEFDKIDVAGYRIGQLFVNLGLREFYMDKLAFRRNSRIEVKCFHNTYSYQDGDPDRKMPGGSVDFVVKTFHPKIPTHIYGFLEFPVVGPEMRILILGHSIPAKDLVLEVTLYCLR